MKLIGIEKASKESNVSLRNKSTSKTEVLLLAIAFFLALVVLLWNIKDDYMMYLPYDEHGEWAIAAWLNGDDWSSSCMHIGYYSYFYPLILALCYHFFGSSTLMYQAAVVINAITTATITIVCYFICKEIDNEYKPIRWVSLGLLCSLYSSNVVYTEMTWAESFLTFITWLVCYLIVKIANSNKQCNHYKYYYILTILLFIGYATHQRFLGFLMAGILMIIYLLITKKIRIRDFLIILGLTCILLLAHRFIKTEVQEGVWLISTNGNTKAYDNDYSGRIKRVINFFTEDGFKATMLAMLGQIYYFGVSTFLIGYLGFAGFLKDLCRRLKTDKNHFAIAADLFFVLAGIFTLGISSVSLQAGTRVDHAVYGRYIEIIFGIYIINGWYQINSIKRTKHLFSLPLFFFLIVTFLVEPTITERIESGVAFQYACSPALGLYFWNNLSIYQISIISACVYMVIITISDFTITNKVVKEAEGLILLGLTIMNIYSGKVVIENVIIPKKTELYEEYRPILNLSEISPTIDTLNYIYGGGDYSNNTENPSNSGKIEAINCIQFLIKEISLNVCTQDELTAESKSDELIAYAIYQNYLGVYDIEKFNDSLIYLSSAKSASDSVSEISMDLFYQRDIAGEDTYETSNVIFNGPGLKVGEGDYEFLISMEIDPNKEFSADIYALSDTEQKIYYSTSISGDNFIDGKAIISVPVLLDDDVENFNLRICSENQLTIKSVKVQKLKNLKFSVVNEVIGSGNVYADEENNKYVESNQNAGLIALDNHVMYLPKGSYKLELPIEVVEGEIDNALAFDVYTTDSEGERIQIINGFFKQYLEEAIGGSVAVIPFTLFEPIENLQVSVSEDVGVKVKLFDYSLTILDNDDTDAGINLKVNHHNLNESTEVYVDMEENLDEIIYGSYSSLPRGSYRLSVPVEIIGGEADSFTYQVYTLDSENKKVILENGCLENTLSDDGGIIIANIPFALSNACDSIYFSFSASEEVHDILRIYDYKLYVEYNEDLFENYSEYFDGIVSSSEEMQIGNGWSKVNELGYRWMDEELAVIYADLKEDESYAMTLKFGDVIPFDYIDTDEIKVIVYVNGESVGSFKISEDNQDENFTVRISAKHIKDGVDIIAFEAKSLWSPSEYGSSDDNMYSFSMDEIIFEPYTESVEITNDYQFGSGWTQVNESGNRWMDSKNAIIYLDLEENASYKAKISIGDIIPFESLNIDSIKLKIYVNDNYTDTITINEGSDNSFDVDISSDDLIYGIDKITFKADRLWSPSEYGSSDESAYSFSLGKITFDKVS